LKETKQKSKRRDLADFSSKNYSPQESKFTYIVKMVRGRNIPPIKNILHTKAIVQKRMRKG
jgi:hypothetical protein